MSTAAIESLKNHQRQLDVDGIEVGVSRQALNEALATVASLTAQNADLKALVTGAYREGFEDAIEHWRQREPNWHAPSPKITWLISYTRRTLRRTVGDA